MPQNGTSVERLRYLLNANFPEGCKMLAGLDYQVAPEDREARNAIMRLRYRMKKGRFPIPLGFNWIVINRNPALLNEQAKCVQRILRASCPEGVPVIEIDW